MCLMQSIYQHISPKNVLIPDYFRLKVMTLWKYFFLQRITNVRIGFCTSLQKLSRTF
jgi:hypothetical protein